MTSPATPRHRVYLVEDQPQLLRGLERALAAYADLELVGSAMDGETASERIPALKPDVVVLDLELPGIDGLEVTRRVKATSEGVEILILTTFDDEAKVYEAMQAGAAGYLVKRVGVAKIHEGILEVMAGGTVVEAVIARRFWNYFSAIQSRPETPVERFGLTPTELEVLALVVKGLSNAEIGRVLARERRNVRTQLSHIYRKLGVNSHVDAVVVALKHGLVGV